MSKIADPICQEHPFYNGAVEPTEGCLACWSVWAAKQLENMPEFESLSDFVKYLKALGFEEIQIISDTPLDIQ